MNRIIIFFLGLLIGIMACLFIYRFDKKKFNRISLENNKEKEVVITYIDTVYLETPQKQERRYVENKSDKLVIETNTEEEPAEGEVSIYDAEFSFEGIEEDVVIPDQLLQTRTVKVKLLSQEKQEGKLPDNFFQFFEIQQWSTPIKNRTTYYRNQNMVKIKGMEIEEVNVVFWNGVYLLETRDRYYAIPETEYFEKLNTVQIPQ